MEAMEGRSGVVQVAYLVDDVRRAAAAHSATFGSGPYFVADHIPLASVEHRGESAAFDHSSAYGQWGAVMVEFVAVHACTPATLAGGVGFGGGGVHHVARFVDDLDTERRHLAAAGHEELMLATTGSGLRFCFFSGAGLGHLLEIYEPTAGLKGFYARVATAADHWDGTDPIRAM
jgi:hypothetical protein